MNRVAYCMIGIALVASQTAAAAPRYARTADAATMAEARQQSTDDVAWVHRGGYARRRGRFDDCELELDIVNPTTEVRWSIVLTVQLKRDRFDPGTELAQIRVPYLLPGQMTSTRVVCDASDSRGFWVGVHSAGLLEHALREMARTALRSTLAAPIEPSTEPGTVLEAALSLDDPAVAGELVAQIARWEVGIEPLVAALQASSSSSLAQHAGPIFAQLPGDTQLAVLDAVLAQPEATRRNEHALVPAITAACASRDRALALWVASLDPAFATPRLRRVSQRACRLRPSDLGELEVRLAARFDARVIDALDAALFAALIERWTAAAPAFLPAYLATTANRSRFEAAARLVAPAGLADVIAAIADAVPDALSELRLTWVQDLLAGGSGLDAVARSVFERAAAHPFANPDYQQLVEQLRARFPAANAAAAWHALAGETDVLDVEKLAAAGIDLTELTAYLHAHGTAGCSRTLAAAVACMRGFHHGGVRGLGEAVGNALKPAFTQAIVSQVDVASDDDLDRASELAALGCPLDVLAASLCGAARAAQNAGTLELEALEHSQRFVGARACLVEVAAAAAAHAADTRVRERARIAAGIAGVAVPLIIGAAICWLWMRRRPLVEPDTVVASPAPSRTDRIASSLARGVRAGVDRARRELSLVAASDPVIERASATAARAIAQGTAASLLARDRDATFYIVAFPVPHAPPKVVQRYLGEPWPKHMHQIQQLVGCPVTALVILCGPNAASATLAIGTCDGTRSSDPELLLDAREARERSANGFHHTIALDS
jgi:hypothetical protein